MAAPASPEAHALAQQDRARAVLARAKGRRQREHEIAAVLVHQGWGHLLDALGLEHLRSGKGSQLGSGGGEEMPSSPVRLRLTLEQLGATAIKLGQLRSTRADLVPPDFRFELAKLQDSAPRLSLEVVREAIANELHEDVQKAYVTFDPEPLAAGSIGQAHAATLPDGTEVVVKVRRPGVVEQVGEDLEILQNLAERASRRWKAAARYDLVGRDAPSSSNASANRSDPRARDRASSGRSTPVASSAARSVISSPGSGRA